MLDEIARADATTGSLAANTHRSAPVAMRVEVPSWPLGGLGSQGFLGVRRLGMRCLSEPCM